MLFESCRDFMAEKSLPDEIGQFYDTLLERVELIKKQTQARLSEIKKEQKELATDLREKLAKGESLRKADFDKMLTSLVEKRKKRQQEVMEILDRFQKEEEEMAAGLKKFLGEGKRVRTKEFKKFLAEFNQKAETRGENITEIVKAARRIKEEAKEMIKNFRKEREGMAEQWQELAAAMKEKRASKK